jgi:hypothetical protein
MENFAQRNFADCKAKHLKWLVHRNEPLRRVTEDNWLLGTPGVWVLVLEAPTGDQHPDLLEGIYHSLNSVAFFTLVIEHAFAREARSLRGKRTILIDGIGDRWIDAASF